MRFCDFFATVCPMKTVKILGTSVHDISVTAVRDFFRAALQEQTVTQKRVYTPNPEIVLYAHNHPDYAAALNRANLALPDGRGLQLLGGVQNRVTGASAAEDLLLLANQQSLRLCVVVREDGRSTSKQMQQAIFRMAPKVKTTIIGVSKSHWNDESVAVKIRALNPDAIFVALGFPEQELWIDAHLTQIPSARIAMAIGGTVDFWTGVALRAPRWIQRIGLEWLWRLVREPRRIKRIWNAVVIFPLTVLIQRKK